MLGAYAYANSVPKFVSQLLDLPRSVWATMELQDEQRFTFCIGLPQRTTMAYNAKRGHVGVVVHAPGCKEAWDSCRHM